MSVIKYLLPMLLAHSCFAGGLGNSEQVATLIKKQGAFDVCDVQARSDGGTTSICLVVNPGKLWLTKRSDLASEWSAVYESDQQPNQAVTISKSDADSLLFSWVKHRYSCAAISDMQSDEFQVSTREDLVAATVLELIQAPSVCSD